MPNVTPTWEDIIRTALEERLVDVRVALPGRVERYDVATQTADIRPQLKRVVPGTADVADIVEELPVVPNVPVAFPRGGGAFVSFPLAVGDFGQLLFNDASLDRWRSVGDVVDPGDVRVHDFGGAVFLPVGVYPSSQALAAAHAANVVVGFDTGAQVHVTPGGEVRLVDPSAAEALALASKVDAQLEALKTLLTTDWVVLPGDGGAALKVAAGLLFTSGWPHTTAAAKTKGV